MANTIICLPPEIVHNILKHVDPIDLARVAGTCRVLRRAIALDRLLCKEVWCLHLVSPYPLAEGRWTDSYRMSRKVMRSRTSISRVRSMSLLECRGFLGMRGALFKTRYEILKG